MGGHAPSPIETGGYAKSPACLTKKRSRMAEMTANEWITDITDDLKLVLAERLEAIQNPPAPLNALAMSIVDAFACHVMASMLVHVPAAQQAPAVQQLIETHIAHVREGVPLDLQYLVNYHKT